MAKLVYLRSNLTASGLMAEIWKENAPRLFPISKEQDKLDAPVLQRDLTDEEAALPIDELTKRYPADAREWGRGKANIQKSDQGKILDARIEQIERERSE